MTKENALKAIKKLVLDFENNLASAKDLNKFGETETRIQYINPFFKALGWKLKTEAIVGIRQSITIAAPHTANMDLPIAKAAFDLMGLPLRFTVKQEWVRFPFKRIMLNLGAIAIDRSPKKPGDPRPSMTEAMANLFKENPEL